MEKKKKTNTQITSRILRAVKIFFRSKDKINTIETKSEQLIIIRLGPQKQLSNSSCQKQMVLDGNMPMQLKEEVDTNKYIKTWKIFAH